MATGVNQAAFANLRRQIAQLCRDLEEFRIDPVAAIDYDKLTKLRNPNIISIIWMQN